NPASSNWIPKVALSWRRKARPS
ncbi:uncharacterized protein METZ01_LOCUS472847, partial [marine metagenome]